MRREDTALVCGIYGLNIFWHLLLCFHKAASRAKQVSAVPASAWPPAAPSLPFYSPLVLTPVFGAGWQTRLVGRCGIYAAIMDIFVLATIFRLRSKASSDSGAVSRAGLFSALGDGALPPAAAPRRVPGGDGPLALPARVHARMRCLYAAPSRTARLLGAGSTRGDLRRRDRN